MSAVHLAIVFVGGMVLTSLLLNLLLTFSGEMHPSGTLILFAQLAGGAGTMFNYICIYLKENQT